ncbi:roadblock/LC7 domain-containing protein [Nocardiopsis sp. ARC36]
MVHTLARGADRRGADQLSALGSFLFSGAGRIGSLTRYGAVDHVVIRLRGGGSLLVRPVGEFLRVVMLTRADTPCPGPRSPWTGSSRSWRGPSRPAGSPHARGWHTPVRVGPSRPAGGPPLGRPARGPRVRSPRRAVRPSCRHRRTGPPPRAARRP